MKGQGPSQYKLRDLRSCFGGNWPQAQANKRWVPARPLGLYGIQNRIKLALQVFTGKADILIWPEGQ